MHFAETFIQSQYHTQMCLRELPPTPIPVYYFQTNEQVTLQHADRISILHLHFTHAYSMGLVS